MKVSRIGKYTPTKGERRHKAMVKTMRHFDMAHPGSMPMRKMRAAMKQHAY